MHCEVAPLNDLKLFFKHKLFLFPGKRGNGVAFPVSYFIFAVFAIMIGTFLWEVYGSTAGSLSRESLLERLWQVSS